jgi:hypothetical protein
MSTFQLIFSIFIRVYISIGLTYALFVVIPEQTKLFNKVITPKATQMDRFLGLGIIYLFSILYSSLFFPITIYRKLKLKRGQKHGKLV